MTGEPPSSFIFAGDSRVDDVADHDVARAVRVPAQRPTASRAEEDFLGPHVFVVVATGSAGPGGEVLADDHDVDAVNNTYPKDSSPPSFFLCSWQYKPQPELAVHGHGHDVSGDAFEPVQERCGGCPNRA